jgi:soluble lytic murein transglycosylase-like protein
MLKRCFRAPSPTAAKRCGAATAYRPLSGAVLVLGLVLVINYAPAAPQPSRSLDIVAAATPAPRSQPLAAPAPPTTPGDENVDAVAGIVARKYRVSEVATREFVHAAYREAARLRLDPLLIVAVMAVESRFNPVAQSESGAMGLMQVIPRYHAEKFDATPHSSVLDPHANIQVGAQILKEYIARGGTELVGLQLYNGALGDPDSAYGTRVLAEKQWLKDALRRNRDRARA